MARYWLSTTRLSISTIRWLLHLHLSTAELMSSRSLQVQQPRYRNHQCEICRASQSAIRPTFSAILYELRALSCVLQPIRPRSGTHPAITVPPRSTLLLQTHQLCKPTDKHHTPNHITMGCSGPGDSGGKDGSSRQQRVGPPFYSLLFAGLLVLLATAPVQPPMNSTEIFDAVNEMR